MNKIVSSLLVDPVKCCGHTYILLISYVTQTHTRVIQHLLYWRTWQYEEQMSLPVFAFCPLKFFLSSWAFICNMSKHSGGKVCLNITQLATSWNSRYPVTLKNSNYCHCFLGVCICNRHEMCVGTYCIFMDTCVNVRCSFKL